MQAIGPYQIERKLGEGGMGSVFAARRPGGEPVALKLLRRDAFLDEVSLERFRREARALGELKHPNIVELRDMGFAPGVGDYLALEIVEGGSYADRLKLVGRLSQDEAIDVLIGLCSAVAAAHERGILHRDLKPANVLRRGEQPVLTDFGLVRRQDASQQLTQTGEVLGTPAYMAPEQAGALEGGVSPATDLYGLGATLYALLTGRPPIGGTSVIDVLMRVGTEVPLPPSVAREEPLHPDLDAICLRCLAKQPQDRFASAAELRAALLDLKARLAGPPPAARSGSVPARALALLVTLPLVGLGGAWGALQLEKSPTRESPTLAPSLPAPVQPGPLPLVAEVSWDEVAFGAPGSDVHAAFRKLASIPPEGIDVPAADLALGELAEGTPAQRLGRLSLWAQVLRRISPVGAIDPRPPSPAWLKAVIRQLRRAHREVAARPQDATARALRGDLWLLYGTRRKEDWRAMQNQWEADLLEAYTDLRFAARRPLASPRLHRRTCKRLFECAPELVQAEQIEEGEFRELTSQFGPLLARDHPSFAQGYVLQASLLPKLQAERLLREALDRVEGPGQRAMIAQERKDAGGLREAVDSPAVPPALRLQALHTLAQAKQIDAALALERAVQIERENAWVRPLAWTGAFRLLAAERALGRDDPLGALKALGTSASTLQDAPPAFLHRWHSLRAKCSDRRSRLQHLEDALRQQEGAAEREDWIAHLPQDRADEQRAGLRHYAFRFRKLTPRLKEIAQHLGMLDSFSGVLRQLEALARLAKAVNTGQVPTQRQLVDTWRAGENATDRALRAYVFSTLCEAVLKSRADAESQRMIQETLNAFQSWIKGAIPPERQTAHATQASFIQAVIKGMSPELQLTATRLLLESADNYPSAPRTQQSRFIRWRSETLFSLARQKTNQSPRRRPDLLRRAREANRIDVAGTGYDDQALLRAAHLARAAEDLPAARAALEEAWALSPPRFEIEALILEVALLTELDALGPEAGLRALDRPLSPPRTDLQPDSVRAFRCNLAALRGNLLSRLGRHDEALKASFATDLPEEPVQRARALRSRAFTLRAAGRGREATPLLLEAFEKTPANKGLVQLELADAYSLAGRLAHARLAWREGLGNGSAEDSLYAIAVALNSHDRNVAARLVEGLKGAQLSPEQATRLAAARESLARQGGRRSTPAAQADTQWPSDLGPTTASGHEALSALADAGPFLTPSLALEALKPLLDSPDARERWAALAMGLDLFTRLSAEQSLAPRQVLRGWAIGLVRLLNLANACVAEQPAPYVLALRGRLWRLYAACLERDYRVLPRAWTRPMECAVIDLRNALRPRPQDSRQRVKLAGDSRMAAWDALFRCAQWRNSKDGSPPLERWPKQLLSERRDAFQGHVWAALHLSPEEKRRRLAQALPLVSKLEGRARLRLELGGSREWSEVSQLEGASSRTRALALVKLLEAKGGSSDLLWNRLDALVATAADPSSVEGWRERVTEGVAADLIRGGNAAGAAALLEQLSPQVHSPSAYAQLLFAQAGLIATQGRSASRRVIKTLRASVQANRRAHSQLLLAIWLQENQNHQAARSLVRSMLARNEVPDEIRKNADTLARQLGLELRVLRRMHDERASILRADRAGLERWIEIAAKKKDLMVRFLLARALRVRAGVLGERELSERLALREIQWGRAWRQKCKGEEHLLATERLATAIGLHAERTSDVRGLSEAGELMQAVLARAPTTARRVLEHRVTQWRIAAAKIRPYTAEHLEAATAAARREAASGEADPTPLLSLAHAYELRSDPRLAQTLAKAELYCPPYWPLRGYLARMQAALALAEFDFETALRHCERGLASSLRSPSVEPALTAHLVQLQVLALTWLRRTDEALTALDGTRGLLSSPVDRSWSLLRAHVLDEASQTDAALAELRRLGKDEEVEKTAYYYAALAYALARAGETEEAARAWLRVDSLMPRVDGALEMVGEFFRTYRFEVANALLERLDAPGRTLTAAQRELRARYGDEFERVKALRKKP